MLVVLDGGKKDDKEVLKVVENGQVYYVELFKEIIFLENFVCLEYGVVMDEFFFCLFFFNFFYGVCFDCYGIGFVWFFCLDLVIFDFEKLVYVAIVFWLEKDNFYYLLLLYSLGQYFDFQL